jgi:hypothetical protein
MRRNPGSALSIMDLAHGAKGQRLTILNAGATRFSKTYPYSVQGDPVSDQAVDEHRF